MIVISKISLLLLVLFYSMTGFFRSCYASGNIALGRPYILSSTPNYPLTAAATDTRLLTDGKYTVGHFWTRKTTLGWQNQQSVEILIDLGEPALLEKLTLRSARGTEGGVNFPGHIFAFTGPDTEHFLYLGDLAADPDNAAGKYMVKQFALENIGKRGRFVLLAMVANGPFIFTDEIEIYGGEKGSGESGSMSLTEVRSLVDSKRRIEIERKMLRGLLAELAQQGMETDGIRQFDDPIKAAQCSSEIAKLESAALRRRAELLQRRFPEQQLVVERVDPWQVFSPLHDPVSGNAQAVSIILPRKGHGYAALALTNVSLRDQKLSLSLEQAVPGAPPLSVRSALFVKSASMEQVADALVDVGAGFTLRAGESRMVFLSVTGDRSGTWHSVLRVGCGGETSKITVSYTVAEPALPDSPTLHSVNWGYLDFMSIRSRQKAALDDLEEHRTNVVVVPPMQLPALDSHDFSQLTRYLALHGWVDRVLLFVNYKSGGAPLPTGSGSFLDDNWKKAFRRWYQGAIQGAAKAGFTEKQVYLYPFDEMTGQDIDRFISLANWARKELPGIKFYGTLNNSEALRGARYFDIVQVIDNEELQANLTSATNEVWLYDAKGPAKGLAPYGYYRLKAWKAFVRGYRGVGFWAYADTGYGVNSGSAWDDFDGTNPDYAVIYEGEGDAVIASRRWEAWRMGLEDYELLSMYARAKGEAAAQGLARRVIAEPADTVQADLARRQMLQELTR